MKEELPTVSSAPPAPEKIPPTPFTWRLAIGLTVLALAATVYALQTQVSPRLQAAFGVVCFFGVAAAFSANLRAVNWRTIGWGFALQILLALFVTRFEVFGYKPGLLLFEWIGEAVKKLLSFTEAGSQFVFGVLADPGAMGKVFPGKGFVFAFSALPTIIFIASFFSVLYYYGVLQFVVRLMARAMMYLLRTSGAETLSVSANIFMGQTEAPLIIKPYVPRMTQSELLTLMVGGMAHISGGVMAVYIGMGANPVAILATSVMAAPGSLYLSKLLLPELAEPETRGRVKTVIEREHANVIDAAAAGASDGMRLALNVAAMLVAFLAFIATINFLLSALPAGNSLVALTFGAPDIGVGLGRTAVLLLTLFAFLALVEAVLTRFLPGLSFRRNLEDSDAEHLARSLLVLLGAAVVFLVTLDVALRLLPPDLSLQKIFSWVFAPVAVLMGVQGPESVNAMADLLGTKLVANEFVAYVDLTTKYKDVFRPESRGLKLATYALTGFANFSSIGIQIGGIGAMAPTRRQDLARLGFRALLTGFLVTLINASIAGMLLDTDDGGPP
jgi:CNT family concentrative nucleoside transporter